MKDIFANTRTENDAMPKCRLKYNDCVVLKEIFSSKDSYHDTMTDSHWLLDPNELDSSCFKSELSLFKAIHGKIRWLRAKGTFDVSREK